MFFRVYPDAPVGLAGAGAAKEEEQESWGFAQLKAELDKYKVGAGHGIVLSSSNNYILSIITAEGARELRVLLEKHEADLGKFEEGTTFSVGFNGDLLAENQEMGADIECIGTKLTQIDPEAGILLSFGKVTVNSPVMPDCVTEIKFSFGVKLEGDLLLPPRLERFTVQGDLDLNGHSVRAKYTGSGFFGSAVVMITDELKGSGTLDLSDYGGLKTLYLYKTDAQANVVVTGEHIGGAFTQIAMHTHMGQMYLIGEAPDGHQAMELRKVLFVHLLGNCLSVANVHRHIVRVSNMRSTGIFVGLAPKEGQLPGSPAEFV